MSQTVFVVVEASPAGDSVLGVFSSIEKARSLLPDEASGRLADYRIEVQVLDKPFDVYAPWQVSLSRDGELLGVEPIIACAYCDEDQTVAQASFIDYGGEPMRIAVWARSKGAAIAAAEAEHRRLLESDAWPRTFTHLKPLHTE